MRCLCLAFLAIALSRGGLSRAMADDAPPRPNIVYILCDDLGYGDVHALNPNRSKIATPNFDRLAAESMVFTDCHSGSAVCTPTRYGILTGRYSWRSSLQQGVLNGMSAPLIARDRLTVASLLKRQGYATAAIGKWHLGLEFGKDPWTDRMGDGPLQHGFDTFFGISASLDMPPFAFIENDRFTQPPTATKKWMREGPAAKDFEAVDVLPELTRRSREFIAAHAAEAKRGHPFFLYLPLASPHTPLVPSPEWRGKSPLGEYGDFVMQTDASVGEVLAALDAAGVAENTLVFFTSDNGFAPYVKADQLEAQGHYPSGDFRGYKADIWEGGHHIPFMVRWPARVKAGSRNDQPICLTDLMATCVAILGEKLPDSAGEDSVSLLPALLQSENAPPRPAVVHHSVSGQFALREGNWKLELCPGSGGWAAPNDKAAVKMGLPPVQLYDMKLDPGEQHNLSSAEPETVARLTALLEKYVADGRSTPGATQSNDATVRIVKKH